MSKLNDSKEWRLIAPPVVLAVVAAFSSVMLAGCFQREVLKVKASRVPAPITEVAAPPARAKIWFVREKNGQLEYVCVEREVAGKDLLNESVQALLQGPTEAERARGLASEIPKGTELLDARSSGDGVELNLSRKFSSDGGSDSIETRLEQLSKTVTDAAHDRSVYLDVEGKRLSEAGGEGVEVHQPINM